MQTIQRPLTPSALAEVFGPGPRYDAQPRDLLTVTADPQTGLAKVRVSLNAYHWLKDRLEYAPDLDERLQAFLARRRRPRDLDATFDFVEKLKREGLEVEEDTLGSTSFGPSLLSHPLHWVYLELFGEPHAVLQALGPVDGRPLGAPRAFLVCDQPGLCHEGRAAIRARRAAPEDPRARFPGEDDLEAGWQTDDGGLTWPADDGGPDLTAYPVAREPRAGHLYLDALETPHCPVTGAPLEVTA